jgi:hypothetical protein
MSLEHAMRPLEDLRERVVAAGAFRNWKHEASSQAAFDLRNLAPSASGVVEHAKALIHGINVDGDRAVRFAVFGILQNLYPIVEALDDQAGLYLGQAVEQLRR